MNVFPWRGTEKKSEYMVYGTSVIHGFTSLTRRIE